MNIIEQAEADAKARVARIAELERENAALLDENVKANGLLDMAAKREATLREETELMKARVIAGEERLEQLADTCERNCA